MTALYAIAAEYRHAADTLAIQDNPPSVVVENEFILPAQYLKQPPPVVDKVAIKAAIKAGVIVPGAHLAQSQRLVIK